MISYAIVDCVYILLLLLTEFKNSWTCISDLLFLKFDIWNEIDWSRHFALFFVLCHDRYSMVWEGGEMLVNAYKLCAKCMHFLPPNEHIFFNLTFDVFPVFLCHVWLRYFLNIRFVLSVCLLFPVYDEYFFFLWFWGIFVYLSIITL